MQCFSNPLVGIDFSQIVDAGQPTFRPPVEHAIQRAISLSRRCASKLTFFSALELAGDAEKLLTPEEKQTLTQHAGTTAETALAALVNQAQQAGVDAKAKLAYGKPWIEIVRQTIRDKHDLVIVGTRDVGTIIRLMFGTTAMKLLRQCPAPVWVSRPDTRDELRNVLVAVDLGDMFPHVVEMGLRLRSLGAKTLRLVHVVDFPLDRLWSSGLPEADTQHYHHEIRSRVENRFMQELERQLQGRIPSDIQVEIIDGSVSPGPPLLRYIERHHVDLLVLGTVTRRGLAGLFLGSTAEWLLPQVRCSVLAIKPTDFQSQVSLD